jgi:hypothetical protein
MKEPAMHTRSIIFKQFNSVPFSECRWKRLFREEDRTARNVPELKQAPTSQTQDYYLENRIRLFSGFY